MLQAPFVHQGLADSPKIFGLLLLEQKKVMARLVGDEIIEQAIASLASDEREEIENLSMFSWCRTVTAASFVTRVAECSGRDPERFAAQVVREGFGVVLRSVWQLFTRYSTDEAIVHRATMIYTKAISRGRVYPALVAPGHMTLEIRDWPGMTRIDLVAIASGIDVCLKASGRVGIRIVPRLQPDGACFDVRVSTSLAPPRT